MKFQDLSLATTLQAVLITAKIIYTEIVTIYSTVQIHGFQEVIAALLVYFENVTDIVNCHSYQGFTATKIHNNKTDESK